MQPKKNYVIAFILLLLLAIAWDKMANPSYSFRYEKVEQNIHHLKQGMSANEVVALVGNPKMERSFTSRDGKTKEIVWVLHYRDLDTKDSYISQIPILTFDRHEKLVKIERLTKDRAIRKWD
jgi:hypothetical protein